MHCQRSSDLLNKNIRHTLQIFRRTFKLVALPGDAEEHIAIYLVTDAAGRCRENVGGDSLVHCHLGYQRGVSRKRAVKDDSYPVLV